MVGYKSQCIPTKGLGMLDISLNVSTTVLESRGVSIDSGLKPYGVLYEFILKSVINYSILKSLLFAISEL